jgi:hypothetical protein
MRGVAVAAAVPPILHVGSGAHLFNVGFCGF